MNEFVVYKQLTSNDCGPVCLRMIANYYGRQYSPEEVAKLTGMVARGAPLSSLGKAAEIIGFRSLAIKASFEQLDDEILLPCILYWNRRHYVVIPPQDYSRDNPQAKIQVADPTEGLIEIDKESFLKAWIDPADNMGVVLVLEPTERFYNFPAGR